MARNDREAVAHQPLLDRLIRVTDATSQDLDEDLRLWISFCSDRLKQWLRCPGLTYLAFLWLFQLDRLESEWRALGLEQSDSVFLW